MRFIAGTRRKKLVLVLFFDVLPSSCARQHLKTEGATEVRMHIVVLISATIRKRSVTHTELVYKPNPGGGRCSRSKNVLYTDFHCPPSHFLNLKDWEFIRSCIDLIE